MRNACRAGKSVRRINVMKTHIENRAGVAVGFLVLVAFLGADRGFARAPGENQARAALLDRGGQPRLEGSLLADFGSGLKFLPRGWRAAAAAGSRGGLGLEFSGHRAAGSLDPATLPGAGGRKCPDLRDASRGKRQGCFAERSLAIGRDRGDAARGPGRSPASGRGQAVRRPVRSPRRLSMDGQRQAGTSRHRGRIESRPESSATRRGIVTAASAGRTLGIRTGRALVV